MPFTLIKGHFHVVGQTSAGNPTGFKPDGDSVQFAPNNPALLSRLLVLDKPVHLSSIGSTQLRMEGIDALELHFQPEVKGATQARQPAPLAEHSRENLTRILRLDPLMYRPPAELQVLPPAQNDGAAGWIAARSLDVHGRPVSFLFSGEAPNKDGTSLTVTNQLLRRSANYKQIASGSAYPLFYDTLFGQLRAPLAQAVVSARRARRGLWAGDQSTSGTRGSSDSVLERSGVTFPKLFRRLVEYHITKPSPMSGFLTWLAGKREQVLDLDTNSFTHFDNLVGVNGVRIRLLKKPERLVFVSDKGKLRPNMA